MMDANDEHDEATDDALAYRDRAARMLDRIAYETQQALTEQGVDLRIFFVVPGSGDAILSFGTAADPSDEEWELVSAITSAVVRRTVGLERSRCRPLLCAMTTPASPN